MTAKQTLGTKRYQCIVEDRVLAVDALSVLKFFLFRDQNRHGINHCVPQ